MSTPPSLSSQDLAVLREVTSPTICNAIETFKIRDRATGFMGPEIKCIFPDLGTLVGYACTAVIGARAAEVSKPGAPMMELWKHVASIPEPRILVVHDVDYPSPIGSFWGEVNGNIFRAQGVAGTITDGGVRDLDEVRAMGFYYFASTVLVSHANLRLIDVGVPVEVGGLSVSPGDLLHADKHGVTNIPLDIAPRIPGAVRQVEEMERKIIQLCQSDEFSTEKLIEMFGGGHR